MTIGVIRQKASAAICYGILYPLPSVQNPIPPRTRINSRALSGLSPPNLAGQTQGGPRTFEIVRLGICESLIVIPRPPSFSTKTNWATESDKGFIRFGSLSEHSSVAFISRHPIPLVRRGLRPRHGSSSAVVKSAWGKTAHLHARASPSREPPARPMVVQFARPVLKHLRVMTKWRHNTQNCELARNK